MQYKIAQQMIQEVIDGKDADHVVKTIVEGEKEEEEVVEEKIKSRIEKAGSFLDKKGVGS